MKELFGSPGKVSGLILRMCQCLFGAASIAVMLSAPRFATFTAFCYLIASMGLLVFWSFGLACLDIHALRLKRDLKNYVFVGLLLVGDWVTSILSLAAACSSAGVVVVLVRDTALCKREKLPCKMFQISVALAFVSWFFIAISSYIIFWLAASG